MVLRVSNVIRVVDPTSEMTAWCEKHLILSNPDYTKKARMGLWLGKTPKQLRLYEEDGDDLILPYGVLEDLPVLPGGDNLVMPCIGDRVSIDYGDPVPLYDYQETAVLITYLNDFGILQSPAGSGKTQMGIALIKKFGKRALWLTHTQDLLQQSKHRAEQYMGPDLIGTITAGKVNIGRGVTFATVQTMVHQDLPRYRDFWDVIIVDECHRVCVSAESVGMFQKVLNNLAARHKIGLSATVHRSDGLIEATYALLGKVVYTVPDEAVGDKIMKVDVLPRATGTQLYLDALNTDGTLNYAKLINCLAEDPERNRAIVSDLWENRDHFCLVLSDRLGHLRMLMDTLPLDMVPYAVMVSGKMTTKKGKAQREQAIEDMRTGKKKFLFATYALAKEGLDIPRLDRLFLTTPQKDYSVITQSVGRVARVFEGKGQPICYDYVDDIPFLVKAYKARCRTYRKIGCEFVEEGE